MAQAEVEKVLDISKEKLFSVIIDHDKYPEFVDGMKKVKTEKNADGTVKAIYDLTTMGKDIHYAIKLTENLAAGTVEWTLIESDFFKKNNGGWKIDVLGPNQVKLKYWLDVEFAISIPGFILKGLVKNSLPGMVDTFFERAKKT